MEAAGAVVVGHRTDDKPTQCAPTLQPKGESGNPLPKAGASGPYPNNHAVFSKNRERLLNAVIGGFF